MAELNNEEQQIYVTIVLRYYNYYVSTINQNSYNDETIKQFSIWFNKFIYDEDIKKTIKEHNYYEI